jgi:uncharacterized protein
MAGPGIVLRAAHYPGRAPIDAYGNGGFRFAGMSHTGALLCLPSGIHGWDAGPPAEWTADTFAPVLGQAAEIDVLLLGCGLDLVPIRGPLRQAFREAGIIAEPMSTGAAVRTYNVLLAEDRAVAAALLAVP